MTAQREIYLSTRFCQGSGTGDSPCGYLFSRPWTCYYRAAPHQHYFSQHCPETTWGSHSCCKRPMGSQRSTVCSANSRCTAPEESWGEEVCAALTPPHLRRHRLSHWVFFRSTSIHPQSFSPQILRSVSPSAALREAPSTPPGRWAQAATRGTQLTPLESWKRRNYAHGVSSFSQVSLNICALSDKGRIFPKILPTLEIAGKSLKLVFHFIYRQNLEMDVCQTKWQRKFSLGWKRGLWLKLHH